MTRQFDVLISYGVKDYKDVARVSAQEAWGIITDYFVPAEGDEELFAQWARSARYDDPMWDAYPPKFNIEDESNEYCYITVELGSGDPGPGSVVDMARRWR